MNLLNEESELTKLQPMMMQNQTETMAFTESQFDFKLPIVDLDDQVESIRKRAEIILEKLLALPTPPKQQNPAAKQNSKKIIPKNIVNEENEDSNDIQTEIVNQTTSQNSVAKSSPPSSKGKKKKSKKKKEPQYIIPKREPIVIPGANERYEQQLILLQQQLQRLNTENNKLQALIREYKMKLRESVIEQEKLQYSLQQSQKHRLHVNPTPKDKKNAH